MTIALDIHDCGLADYRSVLELQHQLRDARAAGQVPDTVLLVEHPPVITLGARKTANRLLMQEAELAARGIDMVPIRRGGGTTAHNPGQIVFYPILDLSARNLGINPYIRTLEAIGIDLLAKFAVQAERAQGYPGLWVRSGVPPADPQRPPAAPSPENAPVQRDPRNTPDAIRHTNDDIRNTKKIASIGVRVSRFITHHGMAVNISNDLGIFDLIIPCGLDGVAMTSVVHETGRRPDMADVKNTLSGILRAHFA